MLSKFFLKTVAGISVTHAVYARAQGGDGSTPDIDKVLFTETDGSEISVRVSGGVNGLEIAPDGSAVTRMPDGAVMIISVRRNGEERQLRFEGANGGIETVFRIDGERQQLDTEAEAIMHEVLPLVLRETGINAVTRTWIGLGSTPATGGCQ